MIKFSFALVFVFSLIFDSSAQKTKEEFYKSLLGKDSLVDFVLKNRDKYRLQFIVTDIQRDKDGQEDFKTYDFTTDEYFYPASMVKLPTALAMFEIIDSLEISRDSYIKMNKDFNCGSSAFVDLTLKRNIPISLAIEDMLSISDNAYYSLFFNVVTPKLLNYKLTERKLSKTNIYGGFTGCSRGKTLETHSYSIFSPDGSKQINVPKSELDSSEFMHRLPYTSKKLIGKYQIENGKKVEKPYDFNSYLDYPLQDIHNTVFKLVFPHKVVSNERFQLTFDSRKYLLKCMGNFPREMKNKAYHDKNLYPDNYYKYSIIGNKPELATSGRYRIFSKIGIAYGFVTESAYVVDFENQKDFLFSVSIYVNDNDIMNDNSYEYNKIARPFIANFTRIIQDSLSKNSIEQTISSYDYFNLLKEIMSEN
jgi:hypothetical protein